MGRPGVANDWTQNESTYTSITAYDSLPSLEYKRASGHDVYDTQYIPTAFYISHSRAAGHMHSEGVAFSGGVTFAYTLYIRLIYLAGLVILSAFCHVRVYKMEI